MNKKQNDEDIQVNPFEPFCSLKFMNLQLSLYLRFFFPRISHLKAHDYTTSPFVGRFAPVAE